MTAVEYSDRELRAGMVISGWWGESLTIEEVIFRRGRGLELHTRQPDGYQGPVIWPHPDETVSVLSAPPIVDEWVHPSAQTSDYPHARVVGA